VSAGGNVQTPDLRPPTPFERFRDATKHVLSVSKEELARREAKWKKEKRRKRKKSK